MKNASNLLKKSPRGMKDQQATSQSNKTAGDAMNKPKTVAGSGSTAVKKLKSPGRDVPTAYQDRQTPFFNN